MSKKIWRFIKEKLEKGTAVQLQIVTKHSGSSPGKKGAKMALSLEGDFRGTIGGGIMEYNSQQWGSKYLATAATEIEVKTLVHRNTPEPDTEISGLRCAGSQAIAYINLFPGHLAQINQLQEAFKAAEPAWLLLGSKGIEFPSKKPMTLDHTYLECLNRDREIFIFGDGHVGRALANNLDLLGYPYHIFPTPKLVEDLDEVPHLIQSCQNAMAIVVTSSADTDLMCLRTLINSPLTYCGIMGSQAKRTLILKELLHNGQKPCWYQHIHAPIGIKINSGSPAEIAVSICAELISIINSC